MKKNDSDLIIYLLIGTIIVLMLMNLGLFLEMRNLQREVIDVLAPITKPSRSLESLPKGFPAPGFDLVDTEGNQLSLNSYRGNNVLLVFSSPSCQACQAIFPVLNELAFEHPETDIIVLSNGDDTENQELVIAYEFLFPVAQSTKEVAANYLISYVPYAYSIDENGLIISGNGFSTYGELLEIMNPE